VVPQQNNQRGSFFRSSHNAPRPNRQKQFRASGRVSFPSNESDNPAQGPRPFNPTYKQPLLSSDSAILEDTTTPNCTDHNSLDDSDSHQANILLEDTFENPEVLPQLTELPASPVPSHKLASRWTMFYRVNKFKSANWDEIETKALASVDSVENFWQILNHLIVPSKMKKRIGPNLMFFREGIRPVWEDPHNQGGGMWGIILKDPKQRYQLLDKIWFESLLACIGETLTFGELVNGIVIQRRQKEDRIQLWTREAYNQDIQYSIGQHYKALLNLDDHIKICYTKHSDMQYITGENSAMTGSVHESQSSGSSFGHVNQQDFDLGANGSRKEKESYSNQLDQLDRLRI